MAALLGTAAVAGDWTVAAPADLPNLVTFDPSLSALDAALAGVPAAAGLTTTPLLVRPDPLTRFEAATDVGYTRGWPFTVTSGRYALDVTPHAGLGFGDRGGSAEAGATLRLGEAARRLGIRDGSAFGDTGRWYLYAAASGRAVGYNFLRDADGWSRSGLSTDEGAFIGDTQAGVAWRRGALQASFGYIHREIKPRNVRGAGGGRDDSVVAFSLSIKPRR